MIDIEKASRAFGEYVKPYDVTNEKIKLKIRHTYDTVKVAEKIACDLKLEKEQIELAKLIGLLHDIGRFEQVRIYNTFKDRDSVDHAKLGIKILFEEGEIRRFIREDTYDKIIKKAIKNHNQFQIEEGLEHEELLQAKIIRDADKTDIFAVFTRDVEKQNNVLYDYKEIAKQEISPNILQKFRQFKQANREEFVKEIDDYINIIAFIFDYNYTTGLKIIKENNYMERIMKPICTEEETKEQMEEIIKIANTYIEQRIRKG